MKILRRLLIGVLVILLIGDWPVRSCTLPRQVLDRLEIAGLWFFPSRVS